MVSDEKSHERFRGDLRFAQRPIIELDGLRPKWIMVQSKRIPFENFSTLRAAFVQPNLRNLRNLRIIHLLETYLRWQILLLANELVNFHLVI